MRSTSLAAPPRAAFRCVTGTRVRNRTSFSTLVDRLTGEIQPKISPAGDRVAYSDANTRTGFVIGAEGGIPEKVCDQCLLPTGWMHDGNHIVFESGDDRHLSALETIVDQPVVDALDSCRGMH